MYAIVVAMALIMWVWTRASRQLVLGASGTPATSPRTAAVLLLVAFGAIVLAGLAFRVLPASVLSQDWAREALQETQRGVVIAVTLAGLVGVLPVLSRRRRPAGKGPASRQRKGGR